MFRCDLNSLIKLILPFSPVIPLNLYYWDLKNIIYYEIMLVIISFFQFSTFCSMSYVNAQISVYKSKFIKNVFVDLFILVLSFSFDYWVLYQISEKSAFYSKDVLNFIDFVYFSIVTFATVGYGDIYVTSTYGRMIVSLEILSYLVILVFIVANFNYLRDENV